MERARARRPPSPPSPSHGRATYSNGGFYTGDFSAGLRCGWGRHALPGGGWYEGEWAADHPHGAGIWMDADGGKFVGTFASGDRFKGVWTAGDGGGAFYDGDWRDGAAAGAGVGTLPSGPPGRYTGAWRAGMPHGRGVAHYVDGARYDGEWEAGLPHGDGHLTRPDGSFYRGEWCRGAEHGAGRALTPTGIRYEGTWVDGAPHGTGRERTPAGETYVGGFARGVRTGRGRSATPDGASYAGDWASGARHGRGKAVFADGTVFDGRWERGAWLQSGACASRCAVSGSLSSRGGGATAGAAATLTILARDNDGQPRLSGGDVFRVWAAQADGIRVEGSVVDRGDGTYSVSLTPTRAGGARLHVVSVAGDASSPVADSPYDFYVAPGPSDPGATVVAWPPAHVGGGCATVCVRVGARDAHGNTLPASAALPVVTGSVSVGGAVVPLLFGGESDIDGKPTGWLSAPLTLPPAPAAAVLDVRVAGRRAPGAPRSLLIGEEGGGTGGPPPRDAVSEWGRLAAALGASDDEADTEDAAAAEATAAKAGVPVVESLTDLWLVSKLQRERGVLGEG